MAIMAMLTICQRCAMHQVDDGCYMIFECSVFDAVQAARSYLFADVIGQDMHGSAQSEVI